MTRRTYTYLYFYLWKNPFTIKNTIKTKEKIPFTFPQPCSLHTILENHVGNRGYRAENPALLNCPFIALKALVSVGTSSDFLEVSLAYPAVDLSLPASNQLKKIIIESHHSNKMVSSPCLCNERERKLSGIHAHFI